MTPKQRLDAKKRDHYQQGSITTVQKPTHNPGGMSHSNDMSEGNPMAMYNPRMLEQYKRVNSEIVANDPMKKGNGKKYAGI